MFKINSEKLNSSIKYNLQLNSAIALSYFLLGIFSQITAIPESHAAPIWPSSGIALGAVLLFGYVTLPGIFFGSFGASAWIFNFNPELFFMYFCIATAAIAGAVAGSLLVQRLPQTARQLLKYRDIIKFLLLAGPVSCLIPATISMTTIFLFNEIIFSDLLKHWFVWWSGDSLGVITFTPITLLLMAQPRAVWKQRIVSVALPAFVMVMFLTLFYQFTIKIGLSGTSNLSEKEHLEILNIYYLSILLYGLFFAYLFMVLLLSFSGRHLRMARIFGTKAALLQNKIATQKHSEDNLIIAKDKADSANQAKNIFLSHISHELRTPLNGILGFTQLLQKKNTLHSEDKEKLNIIQNCSDHLLHLINDILDISKIESGKVSIIPEPFDFKCFLMELMSVFKLKANEKNLGFEVTYNDIPECVESDEKRLRQIVSNLVNNAINFTDQGDVKVIISYSNGRLNLTVKDTGCGISEQDFEKIFEPFVQINTSQSAEQGTGLGLTIALQMLKLLDGSISIESNLNKGSQFSISIPLTSCQPITAPNLSEQKPVVGYEGPKKSIWIVDDNKENAQLLQILLQDLGFKADVVSDGFQCLEWLETKNPDLIIMDMKLPVLNGVETNRSILKINPVQKIIGMSASVFIDEQEKFIESGCMAFIAKPFQQHDLISVLTKALDLNWMYAKEDIKEPPYKPGNKTILVAEDNEINSLLLENLLISLNWKVDIAEDGGKAVEKLLANPYQLALIDLQMPVLDGEDVVKQVRAQAGPNQKTKMIAVSAFAERHKASSMLKKGFDAYLSKPVELPKLEDIINSP